MHPLIHRLAAPALCAGLVTTSAQAQAPTLDSVSPTFSYRPGIVVLQGTGFAPGARVEVDGVPQPVVAGTPTALFVRLAVQEPGFADVSVTTAGGTALLADGLELWPSLRSSTAGLGEPLTAQLTNGDAGAGLLFLGVGELAVPLAVPGILSSFGIDATQPSVSLGRAFFADETPVPLGLALPPDAGLIGVPLFLQGLTLRSLPNGTTVLSWTNLERIDLDAPAFLLSDCSLGCTPVSEGFACQTTSIAVNEELRLTFTDEPNLASLSPVTVSIRQLSTGLPVTGFLSLDPTDPKTILFRPLLSFDGTGDPVFSFQANSSYQLMVPGVSQNLGPFLQSELAVENQERLACVLQTDGGVKDYVPGSPTVAVQVEALSGADGSQASLVPADGATDVSPASPVRMEFDDLMWVSTLLDPLAGTSPSVRIELDGDGDPTTTGDRTPVAGAFQLSLDQSARTTIFLFDPTHDFPAGATVVVELDNTPTDLAQNPLVGDLDFVFTIAP